MGGGRETQEMAERRVRRQNDQQPLNCPRCNSNNTKFCYYNNYSLTQPRYFCKACRRYWTEGGSLRNVPVGGGSRKNKRQSSATAISTSPSNVGMTAASSSTSSLQNPRFGDQSGAGLPELDNFSNMEIYRGGHMPELARQTPSNTFMHDVFGLQEFRGSEPRLGFQVGSGGAEHEESRLQFSSSSHDAEFEHNGRPGGNAQGFWTGMMGGGGAW